MVSTVRALEEDLTHHKAYLDQLLAVVIDQNPNLLTMIGEAQKMRYICPSLTAIIAVPAILVHYSGTLKYRYNWDHEKMS